MSRRRYALCRYHIPSRRLIRARSRPVMQNLSAKQLLSQTR